MKDWNDRRKAGDVIDPDAADGWVADGPSQPEPSVWGAWEPTPLDWLVSEPPRREWLLRYPKHEARGVTDWAGMLPRGKVGILAGAGGSGKSHAVFGLAVAVATGGTWLDTYKATPGRVLVLMGEEDPEEVRRRLHTAAADLTSEQRERAASEIVVVPLAGRSDLALSEGDPVQRTKAADDLVRRVRAEHEAGRGFALVVLDPFSRFAGENSEIDNSAATRFVQVVEELTSKACGSPTVLVVHHTSQDARSGKVSGTAAVRGVTGLTDAVRWCAMLAPVSRDGIEDHDLVRFLMIKANYSRFTDPIILRRGDGGRLRRDTAAEAEITAERAASGGGTRSGNRNTKDKHKPTFGSEDA